MHIRPDVVEYFRKLLRIPEAPFEEIAFPPLVPVRETGPFEWLTRSITTFGGGVDSRLPGGFEAYARIPHERDGNPPPELTAALAKILRDATVTPGLCYFAIWEGWGEPAIIRSIPKGDPLPPPDKPRRRRFHQPPLELPARRYHVFSGPIDAATTSMSRSGLDFDHQSPNLWWPDDHAWCVASEIDLAETFVGGSRNCIARVLADPRLRATEVR